jgi:ADP-ribose pyrophosphatase YjhB (NUDIX family)
MTDREYPSRPIVGIGVVVLKPDAVLLIQRGKPPNLGAWSLPGGAQELGETCETAARRELEEETGLEVGELTLAACFDSIRHDDAGRIHYHYTIIDYAARWRHGEPRPGGDVTLARFVAFDALEEYRLTSAAHEVIAMARRLLDVA